MSYLLSFTCNDGKKLINIKSDGTIKESLVATCLDDGQWSNNILDYKCLGKNYDHKKLCTRKENCIT